MLLVRVLLVLLYVPDEPEIFAPLKTYELIEDPLPADAEATNLIFDLPCTYLLFKPLTNVVLTDDTVGLILDGTLTVISL